MQNCGKNIVIHIKIACFFLLLFCQFAYAQNTTLDSLNFLLSKETKEAHKLELFEEIVTVASNTDFKT